MLQCADPNRYCSFRKQKALYPIYAYHKRFDLTVATGTASVGFKSLMASKIKRVAGLLGKFQDRREQEVGVDSTFYLNLFISGTLNYNLRRSIVLRIN